MHGGLGENKAEQWRKSHSPSSERQLKALGKMSIIRATFYRRKKMEIVSFKVSV